MTTDYNSEKHVMIVEYAVTSGMLMHVMREMRLGYLYDMYDTETYQFRFIKVLSAEEFKLVIKPPYAIQINVGSNDEVLTHESLEAMLKETRNKIIKAFKKQTDKKQAAIANGEVPPTVLKDIPDNKHPPFNWGLVRQFGLGYFVNFLTKKRHVESYLVERNLIYWYKPMIEMLKYEIKNTEPLIAEDEDPIDLLDKFK